MQHLLDFIQEHTLEDHLYFVAQSPAGELELLWKRAQHDGHWQLRHKRSDGPWELVPQGKLIASLASRDVDMEGVKQELHSLLAVQIAFADMVLRDANQQLGTQLVQRFVRGQQGFIADLRAAIERVTERARPSMVVVQGGGAQTASRNGHLSIIR